MCDKYNYLLFIHTNYLHAIYITIIILMKMVRVDDFYNVYIYV